MSDDRVVLEVPAGPAGRELRAYATRRGFVVRSPGRGADVTLPRVAVRSPRDLPRVLGALRASPRVLVELEGDRVLPLENLLAMREAEPSLAHREIWVRARRPEELPGLLGALERGADRGLLEVRTRDEVDRVEELLEHPRLSLDWVSPRLRGTRPGGTGDRVAVDTTTLLGPGEGMLVGSQAACLFLVASEAEGSRFTRPRPFRVNAGPVHAYTLLADGSTRYLSELDAGDRVLVTSAKGSPRAARVGRLKIERRPLTLLEADLEGRRYTLFAQEAETVRLVTPGGRRSVMELRPGERIWGVRLPEGRHFGMPVHEQVVER